MGLFKRLVLPFVLCFMLSAPPGYADTNVKVGTVFFDPPFVMSINQGFDIDLIRTIFQRMKTSYEIIPMDYNQLFTALNDGTIDIAIGGISISPDREAVYIFSLPYMVSKGQFLILKNSGIKSIDNLLGGKVGVIRGEEQAGVFYNYLSVKYTNQFQLMKFDDMEDIITALSNKSITAAFLNQPTAAYWEQNGGGQFKALGEPAIIGSGYGIMALSTNSALIGTINQQLQGIEKDNTYLNLYGTYFSD
ncbi:TPA: transporter substrate-binding domain-containing protein [Legionella feeleii]